MVYIHDNTPWIGGEDDCVFDIPRTSVHSDTRRERIQGLGIKGLEVPTPPAPSSKELKAKRRISKRQSIVSFITKSVETQFADKFGSARASASRSGGRSPSPPPPPAPAERVSPTLWRTSNPSSSSLNADSSVEDLSTYHANLARYKAERAQREAEIGLNNCYDLCRVDALRIERQPTLKEESRKSLASDARKSSGMALGKGLRAYWGGGGASSEGRGIGSVSKASTVADPYWDESGDKEAFKAWFDRLGSEQTSTTSVAVRA